MDNFLFAVKWTAIAGGVWLLIYVGILIARYRRVRQMRRRLEAQHGIRFDEVWSSEALNHGIAISHAGRKLCVFTIDYGTLNHHLADFDDLIGVTFHYGNEFATGYGRVLLNTLSNTISGYRQGGYLGSSIGLEMSRREVEHLISIWKDGFSTELTFRDGPSTPKTFTLKFLERPAKVDSFRFKHAFETQQKWVDWMAEIFQDNYLRLHSGPDGEPPPELKPERTDTRSAWRIPDPAPDPMAFPERAQRPSSPRVPTVQPGR